MARIKYIRYALVAFAALGVFALTAHTNAGDASPTTAAQPTAGAAAPHNASSIAEPNRWQPRYPREDLPTNPPGTWEVYPSPTTNDLTAVDFVDVNNGWACGAGVILRYRNGTWTEEPGQRTRDYRDLDMVTTTDGWAVGREGTTDIWTIWRWDGSSWNVFQTVTGAIYCIDMIDPSHGWIGGNGYFLRFNGTTWEIAGSAPNIMTAIQMFSDTEGRAVGYNYIMRREGNTWVQEVNNPSWAVADLFMITRNKGWGVGRTASSEGGLIIVFEGTWKQYKIFTEARTITELDIVGGVLGWCCGWKNSTPPYGAFLGYSDGKDWYAFTAPTDKGLLGIDIIDLNNGWVVGISGVILKYKPNVGVKPASVGRIKAIYR